jgi:hypothetical protein
VHERIVKPIACWRRQGIQHAAAWYSERHSLRSIAQKSPHFPAAKKKRRCTKELLSPLPAGAGKAYSMLQHGIAKGIRYVALRKKVLIFLLQRKKEGAP